MSYNAHELSNRLLNALDSNYNVVDMQAVNEIISILEKFNITKELLETTRLGKHVNELRRKTSDPALARRAKVLVKRWRDLVIPAVASPAHAGSNRSSAERSTRRPGGTPLTSPALIRQGLSPAVPSPRLPSRPAWGGYESDSQDVILVDDDPPPPPVPTHAHKPATPPVKRSLTPESVDDDKKAKRDKKPKKRRGHGRAGSGVETTIPAVPGVPQAPAGIPNTTATPGANNAWPARNGSGPERRKNGWRRDKPDPYAALVNRIPPAGGKKVKTTAELLEQIQSRTGGKASAPPSPNSPHSPDVMLIEPDEPPVSVDSPLRNGESEAAPPEPQWLLEPLEDEREWAPCICDPDVGPDPACPADTPTMVQPEHVHALHHAFLPGVNGTRAPLHPHKFAVRPSIDPNDPTLFATVVPLYNYSDYANDFCVKNMSRLPLCRHIPATEFAPSPPSPPPRPPPPSPRPYPIEDVKVEDEASSPSLIKTESEMEVDIKPEINERLNPSPTQNDDKEPTIEVKEIKEEPEQQFSVTSPGHRTVERTKENNEGLSDPTEEQMDIDVKEEKVVQKVLEPATVKLDGRTLYENCVSCVNSVPYRYENASCAPVLTFPREDVSDSVNNALESVETERDEMGRPVKATHFAEWHECAKLGDLIALPYVVID